MSFWKIILWILVTIVLAFVAYTVYFAIFSVCCAEPPIQEPICVKAPGCHVSECVFADPAQEKQLQVCTQECVPGTLDCGQGSCQVIDGECKAVFN